MPSSGLGEKKLKFAKPESFVSSSDMVIIRFSMILAIICTLVIFNPLIDGGISFNYFILKAIPLPVGLLILLLPFLMYYGILVMERAFFHELIKQDDRRKELERSRQKIHFTARYRKRKGGTLWELTNRSKFAWTNAKFFVEKNIDGESKTKKIELGDIPPLRRKTIDLSMEELPGSQWRCMVLAEEGHSIDCPERQMNSDYEESAREHS